MLLHDGERREIDARLQRLVSALTARSWPGNMRELESTIALILAKTDGGELGSDLLESASAVPTARIRADALTVGFGKRSPSSTVR